MDTQIRTPQSVFNQPQRLMVPLFQRPYVWNEDGQWEPLWSDVARVAQRVLDNPQARHQPHFLGAVVLQQLQNPVGTMQERTITSRIAPENGCPPKEISRLAPAPLSARFGS